MFIEEVIRMARPELILKQDVITGFSYSFSSALLEKLKDLRTGDRIFKAKECFSDIADVVINHLTEQLGIPTPTFGPSSTEVDKFISLVEEFLAIFKKK